MHFQVYDKTAVESLVPLSTWLTPTAYPKRFKTDFFLLPVEGRLAKKKKIQNRYKVNQKFGCVNEKCPSMAGNYRTNVLKKARGYPLHRFTK